MPDLDYIMELRHQRWKHVDAVIPTTSKRRPIATLRFREMPTLLSTRSFPDPHLMTLIKIHFCWRLMPDLYRFITGLLEAV